MNEPEPLATAHRLDRFECNEAELDDGSKRRAITHQASGASRTFVVTGKDGQVRPEYAMASARVPIASPLLAFAATCPYP